MDRAWLEEQLAQAEMRISEGEAHVARQRDIVAELANDGDDLKSAQTLLAQLEKMLANHVADRDRIRAELAATRY
jgi:septal ring factor EnvC (AmiA/AmiB activator)